MRPQWRHFWGVTREAYGRSSVCRKTLCRSCARRRVVTQGSIFDLPERTWDAATMFFCAESITERQDEFEAACAAYARCVKPGGFGRGLPRASAGYVVADRPFPVLYLSAETIENVFARHAGRSRLKRSASSNGRSAAVIPASSS